MAGSSLIGNLAVTLGLNTAAFSKGATQAEMRAKTLQGRMSGVGKSIAGIGTSLGIGIGIGAIATLTANAFEMASALSESAQKMGVSVEALQELRVAADQTGVSEEQLAIAMGRLNKSMGELQLGKKGAIDAFAQIGLAAEDLKGKTPEQALRMIADALNKLPDVQQRVAIGSQIMGRSFSQLLPLINEGSAGLDKYAAASQRAGQISTADAKKLDELADAWSRLKTRLGVATANMIAGTARFIEFYDTLPVRFWAVRDRAIAAVSAMATQSVEWMEKMVVGIRNAIVGKLNAVWDSAKAKIESVKQAFANMYDAVVGHSYVPDMVKGIADSMAQLQRVMVDPSASAADKVGAIFQNLQGIISQAFGSKAGGIIDIIGQFAVALAPLIFGGGGTGVPGAISESGAIGMASGGSGVFGGRSGVDRNLLSLNGTPIAKVSKGERFAVGPNGFANQNSRVIVELRDEMLDARIADGANVRIMRTYPVLQAGTLNAGREQRRRS